jgi:acetyl-CoA synthetase
MGGPTVYNPTPYVAKNSYIDSMTKYKQSYSNSIENPADFWENISKQFHWETPVKDKFYSYNFDLNKGPISIKWMEGATTNICYNLLDRNIRNGNGDKIAFYW